MLIRVLAVFAFVAIASGQFFPNKRVFEFVPKCADCKRLESQMKLLNHQIERATVQLEDLIVRVTRNSKAWIINHLELVKKGKEHQVQYHKNVKKLTVRIQDAKATLSQLREERRATEEALRAAEKEGNERAKQAAFPNSLPDNIGLPDAYRIPVPAIINHHRRLPKKKSNIDIRLQVLANRDLHGHPKQYTDQVTGPVDG